MKPGLEEVLDHVMTRPDKWLRYDLVDATGEHFKKAYDTVLADTKTNSDKYWVVRPITDDFLLSKKDQQMFKDVHFDVAQRKFYTNEQLYRKNGEFIVSSHEHGELVPLTAPVREMVRTLRAAGLKVRWQKEREIESVGAAVGHLHYAVGREARRLAQEDEARRRDDW